MSQPRAESPIERIAALLAQADLAGMHQSFAALLQRPDSAAWLRALDAAGLLTRLIPELEPARDVDQPNVHFLPVLAHSLETVAAVDWLLAQLFSTHPPTTDVQHTLPVAVQTYAQLRYASVYAEELRAHFAQQLGQECSRAALFRLAALLHDIAKPQTKQAKPGGGVSFHEHQTIGGAVAIEVALRLGFGERAADYIGSVVREHMRPGQFAALDEVTLRAVRRFFHATGDAGPDVLLHALADHMATRGPNLNVAAWHAQVAWTDALLDVVWGQESEPARPLVNGDELMQALGITPGPLVGRLLAAIGEAQAGGDITTPEEALLLARRLIQSRGA